MQVSQLSWQYIGILLSVVWAFGSVLDLFSDLLGRAGQASYSTHQACIDKERKGATPAPSFRGRLSQSAARRRRPPVMP